MNSVQKYLNNPEKNAGSPGICGHRVGRRGRRVGRGRVGRRAGKPPFRAVLQSSTLTGSPNFGRNALFSIIAVVPEARMMQYVTVFVNPL